MLAMTLLPHALRYGALEVPYANVVAAGVGVSVRRLQTYRSILVAYRFGQDPRIRRLSLRLRPGDEGFALELQARIPDRWHGESGFFEMQKRLGFSNRPVFIVVGILTVVVFAGVVLALLLSARR